MRLAVGVWPTLQRRCAEATRITAVVWNTVDCHRRAAAPLHCTALHRLHRLHLERCRPPAVRASVEFLSKQHMLRQ